MHDAFLIAAGHDILAIADVDGDVVRVALAAPEEQVALREAGLLGGADRDALGGLGLGG